MIHSKPFGYIYTDYEEGGALSVSGDFFLISWSYEFQNSCGNIYDMKSTDDSPVMSFYSTMEIQSIEIWSANLLQKADLNDGKLKSEYKKSQYYKQHSPLNYFRDNLVFEVPCSLTLSQAVHELTGKDFLLSYCNKTEDHTGDAEYSIKMVSDIVSDNSTQDNVIDLIAIKKQTLAIEDG